jgi:pyruvate dehydrogenase E1 component
LPAAVAESIIKGMYCYARSAQQPRIRLLGSGAILREVIVAAQLLQDDWHIDTEVWSVTSFSELAREAREVERWERLHPELERKRSFLEECLPDAAPIVAASDYVSAYPGLISRFVKAPFFALGTDGFGRSDTRAALRRFFEVDRYSIVLTALQALADQDPVAREAAAAALQRYQFRKDAPAPWLE